MTEIDKLIKNMKKFGYKCHIDTADKIGFTKTLEDGTEWFKVYDKHEEFKHYDENIKVRIN